MTSNSHVPNCQAAGECAQEVNHILGLVLHVLRWAGYGVVSDIAVAHHFDSASMARRRSYHTVLGIFDGDLPSVCGNCS